MCQPPVFIIGVPRSGTTLLRLLLDAHPHIACGPETPWLSAHHPRTIGALVEFLHNDPYGYTANFGGSRQEVFHAAAGFVNELLFGYAHRNRKRRWAEKTPDNALFLPFIRELFPDARFLHIRRSSLDVAVSTSFVSEHRRGISAYHEQWIQLAQGLHVENNVFNALLRRIQWDRRITSDLAGAAVAEIRYEELVESPEPVLRRILEFLDEPWAPEMLHFDVSDHDLPLWEWGTADVALHAQSPQFVSPDRVGRALRELTPTELGILETIADAAPGAAAIHPEARLASLTEIESAPFAQLMQWINSFAGPLSLLTFTNWSKIWEYPWLWFKALQHQDWSRTRLIDVGSANSPMPWIAAMLGAEVVLIESNPQFISLWEKLRDALHVSVRWHIVSGSEIPEPAASASLVTSFSVIEHQVDKRAALDEVARVLKPGGIFALSFDICEEGMTFPSWNGSALNCSEFEDIVWRHPAFDNQDKPQWNYQDMAAFHAWHKTSAPHHDYVTAAAVLRKKTASPDAPLS